MNSQANQFGKTLCPMPPDASLSKPFIFLTAGSVRVYPLNDRRFRFIIGFRFAKLPQRSPTFFSLFQKSIGFWFARRFLIYLAALIGGR
jgi:hypothetical protein